MRSPVRLSLVIAVLLPLLALVVAVRCWNRADVFVQGRTFFVDPDCYSRMTRVARVWANPARPVHSHEFENWPDGTRPHTTAPFDYLTAGLAALMPVDPQNPQAQLDRAGAWVSPLLAALTAAALWFLGGRGKYATLAVFAVSPILVHGLALGRPDHQSLLIFCAAVALGVETGGRLSRPRAVAGGLAWGLGLWVSLYEPLILLAIFCLLRLALDRRAFFSRERFVWVGALGAVLLLGLFVDGWTLSKPDPAVLAYFENWSRTIGELAHATPAVMAHWCGWLLFAAPLLLVWRAIRERDSQAVFWLGMLVAVAALTWWQVRWGYFLALVFAMALPAFLPVFRKGWIAWIVLVLSLWPVAREWDRMLDAQQDAAAAERRTENMALYDLAKQLPSDRRMPILAPWWQSPALAYWSGQPCVAGSSHESLPGIVDSARFYESTGLDQTARAILARRGVQLVVAYDGVRVDEVSSAILGESAPKESLARCLYERPHSAPAGLMPVYSGAAFRVYTVAPEP